MYRCVLINECSDSARFIVNLPFPAINIIHKFAFRMSSIHVNKGYQSKSRRIIKLWRHITQCWTFINLSVVNNFQELMMIEWVMTSGCWEDGDAMSVILHRRISSKLRVVWSYQPWGSSIMPCRDDMVGTALSLNMCCIALAAALLRCCPRALLTSVHSTLPPSLDFSFSSLDTS